MKDKSGKLLYRYKSCVDQFPYKVERDGKKYLVRLKEKRLLTYHPSLAAKKRREIYHNLWRIEESFKIMKSDLDARPVFLQREDTIKGRFLICYLTVLLERLFQFKILENEFSTSEIFRFFRDFKVTTGKNEYINTTQSTGFIFDLARRLKLPLTNYYLSETQIRSILSHKF